MAVSSPVLLCAWSRPRQLSRQLKILSDARPKALYIALDGAPDSRPLADLVEETRRVARSFSPDFPVVLREADSHLGLRGNMVDGIDWFFSLESEGIVLEDDVIPSEDFFWFAEAGLSRFRDNGEISQISGTNHVPADLPESDSYYFSRFQSIWGFATWRRAWEGFSGFLNEHEVPVNSVRENFPGQHSHFYSHWHWRILRELRGETDTWSASWNYFCAKNGALSVVPRRSLVANVGLGQGATNHKSVPLIAGPPPQIGSLARVFSGPAAVEPNVACDNYLARVHWATQSPVERALLATAELVDRTWRRLAVSRTADEHHLTFAQRKYVRRFFGLEK